MRSYQAHTKAPWRWTDHGDLRGKDGNFVINPKLRPDTLSGVNREADARLIAAAPDLLATLEHINAHNHSTWTEEFQAQVDAAIAKAKGETADGS